MHRRPLLLLAAALAAAWTGVADSSAAAAPAGPTLHGIVQWPASEVSPAAISVTLTPHGGGGGSASARPRTTTPTAAEGRFAFAGLPAGSHLLEVAAPGLAYHPVWVWVRREGGDGGDGMVVEAAYADAPARALPTAPALLLRPAARTSPFDVRATFDPVAFAKTPYGLLLLFVAFAVFALPRLRIDPEEYEELLAEQRARRAGGGGEGGGGGGRVVEGEGASTRLPPPPSRVQQRRGGGGGGG